MITWGMKGGKGEATTATLEVQGPQSASYGVRGLLPLNVINHAVEECYKRKFKTKKRDEDRFGSKTGAGRRESQKKD